MTEQAKVPAIRFAGFTDPWEQRKLENLASFGGGHTPSMADASNYVDGKILWVTSQDVKQHYIENTTTMISEKGAATLTLYPSDSIVIVARSGILRHTIPVAKLRKPATVNQDIKVIQTVDSCDSSWLLQYFIASNKTLLREYGKTGTTVESIDFAKMKSTALMVPYIEEQQAIGSFFSRLDNLITLHQRKYDKLVIFKKSMLEKMFPKDGESVPEIRFAGFTDPWEQRKLGEIADKVTEKNLDGNITEVLTNSAEYGVINQTEFFDHAVAKESNIAGYYVIAPGDFVYNPRISATAPVGPIRRNTLGIHGVMSPLYTVFRLTDAVDGTYLSHFFKTNGWHGFMKLEGNSGARSDRFSIGDATFFEMPIPVPSSSEQYAIGSFFSRLDDLITLHQRKLELLQDIKKSLLDKMFV
ncbi:restriction endonuclease S subunit [Bifidobacterium longum subsp. longum]|uniref:restriction endonuclease subunit S n=1 Tax=Bifidobacterium longum TaxID=216816 RepID=UPI0010409875|nr:restriction endonuclease subunit S [Bifidobacterium longum]TCE31246.1 restriction endonuclease S subunit [Bifidobacterium longum subsp. longum]